MNHPCSKCQKPQPNEQYCSLCGEYKFNNSCGCSYKFTCKVCKKRKTLSDGIFCWKCKGTVVDGKCLKCNTIIPREWTICSTCIFDNETDDSFISYESLKNTPKNDMQCLNCGKNSIDYFPFCWRCGLHKEAELCYNCEETQRICRECLYNTYRCFSCKATSFTLECNRCTLIQVPELLLSNSQAFQRNSDDWECLSCNFYNFNSAIFCEKCDYSRNYSFIQSFSCFYCGESSHDQICKTCFWLYFCSNCEKKIYLTQTIHCGECGRAAPGQNCDFCKEPVPRTRILCRICASGVDKCPCGNSKHPKNLFCRWCRMKTVYSRIKCYNCFNLVKLDYCCFCASESTGGSCMKCFGENSDECKYYCRHCSLVGQKCRKCKQRRWGECCKKQKEIRKILYLKLKINRIF